MLDVLLDLDGGVLLGLEGILLFEVLLVFVLGEFEFFDVLLGGLLLLGEFFELLVL